MKISLNKLYPTLAAAMSLVVCSTAFANGNCPASKADADQYLQSLSRTLQSHDPSDAQHDSVLASEVFTGQTNDIEEAISKGKLNPNAIIHLGGVNNMNDMPILALAIIGCQNDTAKALVKAGANPNGSRYIHPLGIAAMNGNVDVAQFLLDHGAAVDVTDASGQTPLENAVRGRQLATVELLLKRDPNPNREIGGGGSILDLVGNSQDPTDLAIAQALRSHGVTSQLSATQN